jgi:hypothetical protein
MLFAEASQPDLSASEWARAQAGAEQLVLQLRRGASIAGRVVIAATAQPAPCRLALVELDAEYPGWRMWSSSENGEFQDSGIPPGKYVLRAWDPSGLVGASATLHLAAGQSMEGIEIRLVPGAKLRLRYEGESKRLGFCLYSGGLPLVFDELEKGAASLQVVHAGTIEVRWMSSAALVEKVQTVTLQVGELQDVVWDGVQ